MNRPRERSYQWLLVLLLSMLSITLVWANHRPDLNSDNIVNILDISLIGSCFGQDPSTNAACQAADTDHDGSIGFGDLECVTSNFGQSGPFEPCVEQTGEDSNPPTLTLPDNLIVAAVDQNGTPKTHPAIQAFLNSTTANDDVDGPVEPSNDAPDQFPLGSTRVTFTALDNAGNTTSGMADVTVTDQNPPTLAVPANITVASIDQNGTPKTNPAIQSFLNSASAVDNVDGPLTPNNNAPNLFPVGSTLVTFSVTDNAGNSANAQSSVTVIDETASQITITDPTEGSLFATSPIAVNGTVDDSNATVTVNGVTAVLENGGYSATGISLQEGANLITATATDTAGNVGSANVTVTLDTIPPVLSITSPAAAVTITENPPQISVSYSDTGTGVDQGSLSFTVNGDSITVNCQLNDSGGDCTPAGLFPEDNINLQASIGDLAGNTGTATSQFVIEPEPEVLTIAITEPAENQVLGVSPVLVRGTISDPDARILVQDVFATVTGNTFEAEIPLIEGQNQMAARARNDAGNEATDNRNVVLDTIPPSLAVSSPPDRSIVTTNTIPVLGTVTDATTLSCSVANQATPVDGGLISGSTNLVEAENTVMVECEDAAGNSARDMRTVYFDPVPLSVTGIDPLNGASDVATSAAVTVTFSEPIDPQSLGPASFFVSAGTSILSGDISVSADATTATLTSSAGLPAGTAVDVNVLTGVRDADGNPMSTPFTSRFTTGGDQIGSGVLIGEVYDDTRSLPLEGATVEAFLPNSQTLLISTLSDERGRYLLDPGQSNVLVRVSKAGFSTVERFSSGLTGSFEELLDARLTPIEDAQPATMGFGGDLKNAVGDALTILPGAVAFDVDVSFTAISPQGPRLPFPPGWTPLGIAQINSPEAFNPSAIFTIENVGEAAIDREAVAVQYDEASASWLVRALLDISENIPIEFFGIPGTGQYAIIISDLEIGALQTPALGQKLPAADTLVIPENADAAGKVVPSVGRADDPTPAKAQITITSDTSLRSGTQFRGEFMEIIMLRDGGQVAPANSLQDFIAYRTLEDPVDNILLADFPIAASRLFGPTEVTEGTITVTLSRQQAAGRDLIGLQGGGLQIDDGSRVVVPVGSIAENAPVDLRRLDSISFPADLGSELTFVGGLELDLSGTTSNNPLTLALGGAASLVPTGSQVVVASLQEVLGRQRLVFVALGRVEGDDLVTDIKVDGFTLPGIRTGGRYGFFRFDGALEIVPGTARDEAGRRDEHVVEIDGLSLVSITDGNGAFALVSSPGSFSLIATAAELGDQSRVEGSTTTALPEIVIGSTPPRVEVILVRLPKLEGNFSGPVALLGNPAPVIDDDDQGGSVGNGNGQIDAGEQIELSLSVRNDGTIPIAGGFFVLSISGPSGNLEVTPETIPLDTLPPDEPLALGPFVYVAPPTFDPSLLRYTLSYFNAGGLANTLPFDLPLDVEHPDVSMGSEITIRFSEPIDRDSLTGTIILEQEVGAQLVPVSTSQVINKAGNQITLRPVDPLADDSIYRLTLGPAITDLGGRALAGAPVIERLRTMDATPPEPIDPGRIEASVPDGDGFITVTGSLGSVNPDDTVIGLNETTGFSVLATVNSDGSFSLNLRAEVSDQLTIIVRDRSGNETRIGPGALVRRDAATGEVVSAVIGRDGGTFTTTEGISLDIPTGALPGAIELSVSRVTDPFALPDDIISDPEVEAAFNNLFDIVDRVRVDADHSPFREPIQLSLPAPPGSVAGDLFLVVRSRTVTIGGALADIDQLTGLTPLENPVQTLERLEVIESASVKNIDGDLVLSTDSPPFSGIIEAGLFTLLKVNGPLTFFAGEVRRDLITGPLVSDVVVRSPPDVSGTSAFSTVTDKNGQFVIPDADLSGPYEDNDVVSGRLDVMDSKFTRVIRRDVRGVVGPPAPQGVDIAHLDEPFVLPERLPPKFIDILGDIEPPNVEITIEGPSLDNGFSQVGAPLIVTVTATDNDQVEFVGLEVDQGAGLEPVALTADGIFQLTPQQQVLIKFRAQAIDPNGNTTFADAYVRIGFSSLPGGPIIIDPPPCDPLIDKDCEEKRIDNAINFDGDLCVRFSEPIDSISITNDAIRVLNPEGEAIPIEIGLDFNDTRLCAAPKRNLRLGADYMLTLSTAIMDLDGETFPGLSQQFSTLPPLQVATIELPNTEDVAIRGDFLFAVNHPDDVSIGDNGHFHIYRVRDDAGDLLEEPILMGASATIGRPLSLAIDGTKAYVGNRFLGAIAIEEPIVTTFIPGTIGTLPDTILGCTGFDTVAPILNSSTPLTVCSGLSSITTSFPQPPSNLQVFDLNDPAQPLGVGAVPINSIPFPFDIWNPNTWPHRVEVTPQGIGVQNFSDNLEFFTQASKPESLGVVGQIRRYGEVVPRGNDGEQRTDDDLDNEFLEAAFFDGFAVNLVFDGIRIVSTQGVGDPFLQEQAPELDFIPLNGTFGGRIGGVADFQPIDDKGNIQQEPMDLAFVATTDQRLSVFDVTNPSNPKEIGVLPDTFGNMSFDACRGIAYLHGRDGRFHVVDFNDPFDPKELNDPGMEISPFQVNGLGSRLSFNGNANQGGAVYLAGENGVTISSVLRGLALKRSERRSCAPKLTAPPDTVMVPVNETGVPISEPVGAAFFASAVAVDNLGQSLPVQNNAPEVLPFGDTIINFTASDESGQKAEDKAIAHVIDLKLAEVSFRGSGEIPIIEDKIIEDKIIEDKFNGQAIEDPVWELPEDSQGLDAIVFPIAYISQNTKGLDDWLVIEAVFKTDLDNQVFHFGSLPNLVVRATLKSNNPSAINVPGTLSFAPCQFRRLFFDGTCKVTLNFIRPFTQKAQFDVMDIVWEVSDGGTKFVEVDNSQHEVYITLNKPIDSKETEIELGKPLFRSILNLATSGGIASNEVEAVKNTWKLFSNGEQPANVKGWDNRKFIYYPKGSLISKTCAISALQLITSKNGAANCRAFALLLMEALRANGIKKIKLVKVHANKLISPAELTAGLAHGFLVNEWDFLTGSFGAPYQWEFIMNPFPCLMVPKSELSPNNPQIDEDKCIIDFPVEPDGLRYGDLISLNGIPGQNSEKPSQKAFSEHYIVSLKGLSGLDGGQYYDPSYGKIFVDKLDFEKQAVAGYWVRIRPFINGSPDQFGVMKPEDSQGMPLDLITFDELEN